MCTSPNERSIVFSFRLRGRLSTVHFFLNAVLYTNAYKQPKQVRHSADKKFVKLNHKFLTVLILVKTVWKLHNNSSKVLKKLNKIIWFCIANDWIKPGSGQFLILSESTFQNVSNNGCLSHPSLSGISPILY
jgi:hypothetical protein